MKFPMFEIKSNEFIDDYDFTSMSITGKSNTFFFKTLADAESYILDALYIDCCGNGFKIEKISLTKNKGFLFFFSRRKYGLSFRLKPIEYNISLESFKRIYIERLVAKSDIPFNEIYNECALNTSSINEILNPKGAEFK